MFASTGRFDETTVALSMLSDLPIGACERAMAQERAESILMMARAIGLSWETAKAILRLRAGQKGISPSEMELCLSSFSRLKLDTARKALQFLRFRERAAVSNASPGAYQ
jgi:hypothetical protein